MQQATAPIGGLMIGQAALDRDGLPSFRVVVIDPGVDMVQAEDAAGTLLIDTIEHFLARHACR